MKRVNVEKCYSERCAKANPEQHCCLELCEGWGCRYLYSMGTWQNCLMTDYWYTHGKFNRLRNLFYFDKDEITYILLKEVKAKGIEQCPAFSVQHLLDLVAQLPDKVFVDGVKWTYYDYYDTQIVKGKPKKVKFTAVAPLFDDLFNFSNIEDNVMIKFPEK